MVERRLNLARSLVIVSPFSFLNNYLHILFFPFGVVFMVEILSIVADVSKDV